MWKTLRTTAQHTLTRLGAVCTSFSRTPPCPVPIRSMVAYLLLICRCSCRWRKCTSACGVETCLRDLWFFTTSASVSVEAPRYKTPCYSRPDRPMPWLLLRPSSEVLAAPVGAASPSHPCGLEWQFCHTVRAGQRGHGGVPAAAPPPGVTGKEGGCGERGRVSCRETVRGQVCSTCSAPGPSTALEVRDRPSWP